MENAVLNPSKSFLALKKSNLGFCQLLKDCCLKNWEKHRANTLSTNRFLMVTFLILLTEITWCVYTKTVIHLILSIHIQHVYSYC